MNTSTIITMFYDIRKLDNDNFKNTNYYYELASNFILLLPYPIIIFIVINIAKNKAYIHKLSFLIADYPESKLLN